MYNAHVLKPQPCCFSLHLEDGFSLNPHKSELSPHPTLSSPLLRAGSSHASASVHASAKELELENICKSLQKQVCHISARTLQYLYIYYYMLSLNKLILFDFYKCVDTPACWIRATRILIGAPAFVICVR